MRYIEPKMELRCFEATDIITTSGTSAAPTPEPVVGNSARNVQNQINNVTSGTSTVVSESWN